MDTLVSKYFSLRPTWVQTISAPGIGYLHTPTATGNYSAPSMQKHSCCRNFVAVFGKPDQTNAEWLMGLPPGATSSQPLEMDKFQSWLRLHFES